MIYLRRFNSFAKTLFLCGFCLLFLTSCSSTKIAYNLLDVFIQWQLGKYVSMNKDQKHATKAAIDEFHAWHRQTQLTDYANYIDGFLARLAQGPISGEAIHKETDEVQVLLDASMEKFLPIIANLVSTFDDKQCQQVLDTFAEKKEEYREEYVDISQEKLYKTRKKDLTDELGTFFGRFSREQKQLIESWTRDLIPYEEHTLNQYDLWSNLFSEAFAVRNDRAQLTEKLRKIMLYRTDDWDQELQDILDKNQEITYELIAKLINSQSQQQREKFVNKLRNYEEDFRELADS